MPDIYKQQGSSVEKLVPIKLLKENGAPDEEYDLKYIKSCKAVKFARHHKTGDPVLSIQNGRYRFPTPIALRTRAKLRTCYRFIFSNNVAICAIWVIFWPAGMYLYNVPWQ